MRFQIASLLLLGTALAAPIQVIDDQAALDSSLQLSQEGGSLAARLAPSVDAPEVIPTINNPLPDDHTALSNAALLPRTEDLPVEEITPSDDSSLTSGSFHRRRLLPRMYARGSREASGPEAIQSVYGNKVMGVSESPYLGPSASSSTTTRFASDSNTSGGTYSSASTPRAQDQDRTPRASDFSMSGTK